MIDHCKCFFCLFEIKDGFLTDFFSAVLWNRKQKGCILGLAKGTVTKETWRGLFRYSAVSVAVYDIYYMPHSHCLHCTLCGGSRVALWFLQGRSSAWASQVAPWWRILLLTREPQETWLRSLDQEDPLEEEMATHSSILAWRIPWTEEPGGLQSVGSQRVGHDQTTEHRRAGRSQACVPH